MSNPIPSTCRSCGQPLDALSSACEEGCTHACSGCGRHWTVDEWHDEMVRLP